MSRKRSTTPCFQKGSDGDGDRQKGRLKADSVIDCEENAGSIRQAIQKALTDDFKANLKNTINPYGDGNSTPKIITHLKQFELKCLRQKKFYDIN